MRITIWGARGSIPTPIRPEDVQEKIISALLNIVTVKDDEFREKLISTIVGTTNFSATDSPEHLNTIITSQERRDIIKTYLHQLSPLAGTTAGGNTPCIEIKSGKELFVIDAGSGIRSLGNELMAGDFGEGKGVLHLFFSHPHWDHIQGFPFFRPAYVPGNKIFIYGVHDIKAALLRQQEFISFPVPLERMHADMEFIRLDPTQTLEFNELRIRLMHNHHPGDAYAFRIEKGNKAFVYASDAAYPTGINLDQHVEFFHEADVLIFDAQFTQRESDEKEDWGHSSSFFGVEMAQRANVKNLVLFHYDPNYADSDLEKILKDTLAFQHNQYPTKKPVEITIAQEGLTFDLMPTPTTQLKQVPGGRVAILKPAGIFDENIAAELLEQLVSFRERSWPPQLIVDLSSVEMLQVAGLKALVKLRKEQQGMPMVLAGPSINVQQLIDLAGYSDFFAIYPSVHAALNALKAHETLNLPGQTIKNRYYIEAKIGDGRLGTVFKATDKRYNRSVALKVLSPSFSEGAIEQFLGQARQIIDLIHPNVVDIYDCDEDRGLSFMTEEFIEGGTLRELIDSYGERPIPLADALGIAEKIASGLEYAHAHGVIHGDLKPKNVLLHDNELKISDFGLGRLESGKSLLNIDIPLAMISARYVAPEQILGHPIDARTDLYALGAILYELFTAQPVFNGTDDEVLTYHKKTAPRPPRQINPLISHALEHLILKLLDKDPNKRYVKASQVRRILGSMITFSQGAFIRRRWPAFVDNQEPLQTLADLWEATKQGQGQVVLLDGASGVGKTRLSREFTQAIAEATVLIGKCQQFDTGSAYHPLVEALKTYFSSTAPEIALQEVGLVLQDLGKIVPEIQQFIPEQLAKPDATRHGRTKSSEFNLQRRISSNAIGLADLIQEAAEKKPWLLVMDDLHRADPSTLQMLQYLSRHAHEMRLMIIGIYQNTHLIDNAILQETVEVLANTPTSTALSLPPLSNFGVKEFLQNIWLQEVPPDLITAIYRRTNGNALFVEEVAKGLVDDGVVSWRDNRWHFAPMVEAGLPKDVTEALVRRINRLSKETQTLLQQAAVLGQTFHFSILHEMSDLSTWDALESLDIALERQFIKEIPGEGVLRFKHIATQQVLYQSLSPLKRQLLHREAAESMERRYSAKGTLNEVLEALAYHFYEAGEFRKSLGYSRQAAQKATSLYATQTAVLWYTQALDALEHLGEDDVLEAERFELLLAREGLYHHQGQRQGQVADLSNLRLLAQSMADPAKQSMVHSRQAQYERETNQLTEALTEAQGGLIAARQAHDPGLEAECLVQSAYVEISRGDFTAAFEHAKTIQKLASRLEDQALTATLYDLQGVINVGLRKYDEAEGLYEQALSLNRSLHRRMEQADNLYNLSRLYILRGEYIKAETICRQSLEINRAIGRRRAEAMCLHNLALVYRCLGHYQVAEQYIEKTLPLRYTTEDHQGEAEDLRELGTIYRLAEDYTTAQLKIEQALEIFQRLELRLHEAESWLELGFLYEDQEDLDKAQNAYEQARLLFHTFNQQPGELEARAGLARCLLASGKADSADEAIVDYGDWLATGNAWEVRDSVRLHMTIYRVLRANKKSEEAKSVLDTVQALIQKRANSVDDLDMPTSLMESPSRDEILPLSRDEVTRVDNLEAK